MDRNAGERADDLNAREWIELVYYRHGEGGRVAKWGTGKDGTIVAAGPNVEFARAD